MNSKNIRRILATALAATAFAGVTATPAQAASASCNANGAAFVLAGPRVGVSDSTGTYADSCFRLYNHYKTANRVVIDFGVRDTANNGQRAVTEVCFFVNGVWGAPQRLSTTALEADSRLQRTFNLVAVPTAVAYRVAQVTDSGVVNTYSGWYWWNI